MGKLETRLEVVKMLISSQELSTQEELMVELKKAGFPTAQATLSRDLKRLRVVKVQNAEGDEIKIKKRAYEDIWEEGMEEGMEKGMEKGKAEGLAEGKVERNVEIARSMKAKGYAIGDIADITGLTAAEIEAL